MSYLTEEEVEIPEDVQERTENLLSYHRMTNQQVILETAMWWLKNVGNCKIYRYIIHYLDVLENDMIVESIEPQSEAFAQADAIGLEVDK